MIVHIASYDGPNSQEVFASAQEEEARDWLLAKLRGHLSEDAEDNRAARLGLDRLRNELEQRGVLSSLMSLSTKMRPPKTV